MDNDFCIHDCDNCYMFEIVDCVCLANVNNEDEEEDEMNCEGCQKSNNKNNFVCRECLDGDLKIMADNAPEVSTFEYSVSENAAMFYSDEDALQDRKNFVKNLGILASQTRNQVIDMELKVDKETDEEHVIITYKGGSQKFVNVRLDSYSAIVRDVFKQI